MSPDLEALRRTDAPSKAERRPRAGLVVGIVLLAGALGWAFLLIRPALFPARGVETARVRVETGPSHAGLAVEAAGWVEPDPFPTVVRPRVDGIVESIDVLEGAQVKAGVTVVAHVTSAAIEASLERAEKTLAHRLRHVAEAEAEAAEATSLLAQRLDLRKDLARAEGDVSLAAAARAVAAAEVKAAEQVLAAARAELDAQEFLERSGQGVALAKVKAASAVAGAEAAVESKRAEGQRLEATKAAAEAQRTLAREALDAPRALEGAAAQTAAHVAAAKADADAAETDLEIARREAGWLVVVAPADGVVLRREAAPGSAVGPSAMPRGSEPSGPDSGMGGVVSLYDPRHLQVRVDVPLSSVGGIGAGQRAEITVEALPGRTFHGAVARVQPQADPLKNTLQVKVRVEDPDPLLRPEMLAHTRFLADPKAGGAAEGPAARVLVPKRAIRGDAVFVIDPRGGGRARRIPVTKVAEEGDLAEVTGELSATQEVILSEGVAEGDRVKGGGP